MEMVKFVILRINALPPSMGFPRKSSHVESSQVLRLTTINIYMYCLAHIYKYVRIIKQQTYFGSVLVETYTLVPQETDK